MRIAYLDAFSGISGDMTVGALLDLGLPIDAVRDAIAALRLDGVTVAVERTARHGIAASKFQVRVHGRHPDAPQVQEHHHRHEHHHHAHGTSHHVHVEHHEVHHQHDDGHRPWVAIRDLLATSPLAAPVRERALAIFAQLAEAEAHAHGVPVERVEFHEVGALDAIVDVVGAALGFVHLGVDAVYASPLPLGRGLVRAAHGPIPVPGPAVTHLLRGRPVRFEDGVGEMVTPTGAAIVAAIARPEAVPVMRVDAVGWGAGDKDFADRPNLLRLAVGQPQVDAGSDDVVVLEATIDDLNPQIYEHVLERLLAAGARDAWLVPVVMKKSRPGTMLQVLAAPADRDRLAGIVLAETSSIGLRHSTRQRIVLPREEITVETPYGGVRVKIARAPDGTRNIAPEFDDCRRLATERGVALKAVHQAAIAAALAVR